MIYKKIEMEPIKLDQVPDLIKLGYLKKNNNDEIIVDVPIISLQEHAILTSINQEYTNKYLNLIGDRLFKYIEETAIVSPSHVKHVSAFGHLVGILELSLTYLFKAIEEGVITIDKNKNNPISMLIENNNV